MASLEIDEIMKNPDSRIRVVLSFKTNVGIGGALDFRSTEVVGFNQSGFSLSVANEYNNPLENDAANALNQKLQLGQSIGQSVGLFGKEFKTPFSLKTALSSINSWVGSQRPMFNLNFYLIAYQEDHNILDDIDKLNELFFPIESVAIEGTPTLAAPQGYLVDFSSAFNGGKNGRVQGTVTLALGRWFLATNLNPSNFNAEISQETLRSGLPLYAQVSISLTPYKILSVADIKGYINRGAR